MFGKKKVSNEHTPQQGTHNTAIVDPLKAEVMAYSEVQSRDKALIRKGAATVLNSAILNGTTSIAAAIKDYEKETTTDPERQRQVAEHLSMFVGHDIEEQVERDIRVAEANITAASNVAEHAGAYYDDAQARAVRAGERSERISQIK